MRTFGRIFIAINVVLIIFVIFITRDGNNFTPSGDGEVVLDSGTYEGFTLPDFAAAMVNHKYKSYFIEVEPGIKIHVLEAGEGFPVFLMHGNPTSGFLYRKVVENLPLDKVRVIMPTSPGLGFSSKIPASEHKLENHIRWISKVLNELELKELIYAGQDWGGPIGMGALSLSPNLIKGAVILNTGFNAPTINIDLSPAHATVKTPVIGELIVEVFFSMFDRLGAVQGDPESWTPEVAELYGKPLYDNSNLVLKKMFELTNGQIPLIGVGGISSGRDCYEKIKSGASLVQLYTALVYSGPNLINSIKGDLIDLIKTDGYKNISEVIGKSV